MPGLQSLPLELTRIIASSLSSPDICALALSNKVSYSQLLECEEFSTDLIKTWLPLSSEAKEFQNGQASGTEAILKTFFRRHNLTHDQPCTVLTIGHGNDFLYRDGVLCSLRNNILRIIDVHAASTVESELDLDIFLPRKYWQSKWKLNCLRDNTLSVISGHTDGCNDARIIKIQPGVNHGFEVLWSYELPKIVMLSHNSEYFAMATRSSKGPWHTPWSFHIGRYQPLWSFLITVPAIEGFPPLEDLGSTLAMEIIDDHFWAVTSEVTKHSADSKPTSVYRGMLCRLAEGGPQPHYFTFYRREHSDGPVHDLWSKLRMCKSETSEHLILETRREWLLDSPGDCTRSFYTLSFDPDASSSVTTLRSEDTKTLTYRRRPVIQRSNERIIHWDAQTHAHREPLSSAPWISLAQSLYATYDPATRTSIDIIRLKRNSPDMRFRIGHEGQPVRTWPGQEFLDKNKTLGKLFRSDASSSRFRAASDERLLVFGACDGPKAPIVLVCFDPTIDFVQARKRARETCGEAPEAGTSAAAWMHETIWARGLPVLLQRKGARPAGKEDGET